MENSHYRISSLAALCLLANVLVWPVPTCAEFSDDQYPQQPEILVKLIAVAQTSGGPFASAVYENTTYYLRRAEYIGSCEAPFGRVHSVFSTIGIGTPLTCTVNSMNGNQSKGLSTVRRVEKHFLREAAIPPAVL